MEYFAVNMADKNLQLSDYDVIILCNSQSYMIKLKVFIMLYGG
ncbi:hypothetical protein HMPREF7215_1217 [Pyramidobacter piscolens W5455]|uniref:Uncharacterized protein n=1 Tax=Pyramidobacter piscolens W5455 TaxID=352165 RepID=A0ABM9ZTR7_9BACT|nr:hypothetical protein HMPREF7215_1217 [Pyramidobacter piscolens W5455]